MINIYKLLVNCFSVNTERHSLFTSPYHRMSIPEHWAVWLWSFETYTEGPKKTPPNLMFQISCSYLYNLVEFNFGKIMNLNTQRPVLVYKTTCVKNSDTANIHSKSTKFASPDAEISSGSPGCGRTNCLVKIVMVLHGVLKLKCFFPLPNVLHEFIFLKMYYFRNTFFSTKF